MTTIHTELPGEDIATNEAAGTPPPDPISELRDAAALKELQHLREDVQVRDLRIAELQSEISGLRSPTSASPGRRIRGGMSARVGAEDQTTRQRRVDDAVTHATATGRRHDLLSYLRLRRKR